MQQLKSIDDYIELVKRAGIEEAYKQRFRATGRTIRDVLKLTLMLSEGKLVALRPGAGGHSVAQDVFTMISATCFGLNMQIVHNNMQIIMPDSGGCIEYRALGRVAPSGYEDYQLHG